MSEIGLLIISLPTMIGVPIYLIVILIRSIFCNEWGLIKWVLLAFIGWLPLYIAIAFMAFASGHGTGGNSEIAILLAIHILISSALIFMVHKKRTQMANQ